MEDSNTDQPVKRERLLEAAAAVFVEQGFRGATVREICRRAGANIAAVNYHFGSKERLYQAVLQHGLNGVLAKHPPALGLGPEAPPEQRLDAYIRSFLRRIFDRDLRACHGKLMMREMVEPGCALDEMVDTVIRPLAELLWQIVSELLGPGFSHEQIQRVGGSIAGQCMYYSHCYPMLTRLFPTQSFEPPDIERLADHITDFSLKAIKAMAAQRRTETGQP